MYACKTWIIMCLLCMHSILQSDADANLSNHKLSGLIQWKYEKRPFCNAFTGCGKKRTALPPYPMLKRSESDDRMYGSIGSLSTHNNNNIYNNEDIAAGLSDLIDINAEPAVENVQKQIMSQAKIFEAIREASKEIFRQKNKQKLREQERQMTEEEAENV